MNFKRLLITLIVFALFLTLWGFVREQPTVERQNCVGCGDCTAACPTGAITLVRGRAAIDPAKCIDCGFCVRTCTYRAIRRAK